MVLSLKTWKSRSLPGLPKTKIPHHDDRYTSGRPPGRPFCFWRCPPETKSRRGEIRGGFLLPLKRYQASRKKIATLLRHMDVVRRETFSKTLVHRCVGT